MAYTNIKQPNLYFNTKLYTGNGTDNTSITGVGFQPDFVWSKNRDNGTRYHALTNVISGATKFLSSNATSAEQTDSTTYQSFDSDGFTVGTNANTNENGSGIVSWNWLADNTSGSANTDGSISSTVSANTTSGFSIVSYTGTGAANATIGHGLGVTPAMIIVKNRSITENWRVWHHKLGGADYKLALDSTGVADQSATVFNGQSATTFTVGTDPSVNGSGNSIIAYCFAEKQGFSKFGSYTGNGNADGTFVYTGFKPAFVMVKSSSIVESWYNYDNKRTTSGGNPEDRYLLPNQNIAEGTFAIYDFLSNGFKIRNADNAINNSGASYIYMAFAEQPLVGDNPATAR